LVKGNSKYAVLNFKLRKKSLWSFVSAGSFEKDPVQDACVKYKYYLRSMLNYVLALSTELCSAGSSTTDLAGAQSFAFQIAA